MPRRQAVTHHLRNLINQEGGQALVLGIILFTTLMAAAAISLDIGDAMVDRARAQRAADSASLAAATALMQDSNVSDAINAAQGYASSNGYANADAGTDVTVNIPPVSGPYAGNAEYAEVIIEHEQDAYFAQIFGMNFWNVSARAVASSTEPFNGVMPWAVLEDAINIDGSPTIIKYDAANPTNGNFGALSFDLGSKVYENNIKFGVEGPICALSEPTCSDPTEETATGNLISGTRNGVNYRIDNTINSCDEFDEVFVDDGNGGYNIISGCNPFEGDPDSLRVLLVPVIDSFCKGHCEVTFQYFTLFFLNSLGTCRGNNCEVEGTFVQTVYEPSTDLGIELGQGLIIYLVE